MILFPKLFAVIESLKRGCYTWNILPPRKSIYPQNVIDRRLGMKVSGVILTASDALVLGIQFLNNSPVLWTQQNFRPLHTHLWSFFNENIEFGSINKHFAREIYALGSKSTSQIIWANSMQLTFGGGNWNFRNFAHGYQRSESFSSPDVRH